MYLTFAFIVVAVLGFLLLKKFRTNLTNQQRQQSLAYTHRIVHRFEYGAEMDHPVCVYTSGEEDCTSESEECTSFSNATDDCTSFSEKTYQTTSSSEGNDEHQTIWFTTDDEETSNVILLIIAQNQV